MRAGAPREKVELTTKKFAHENASGGMPAIATTPSTSPSEQRWVSVSPRISEIFCVPYLGKCRDGKEDGRLGEAVHGHLQEAAKFASGPPIAEGENDDAHMFDRRVREHPFDVAARYKHEGGEDQRDKPIVTINAQVRCRGIRRQQHLETQHRIEATFKSRPRAPPKSRRAFRVASGSQHARRKADLGTVSQQKEK